MELNKKFINISFDSDLDNIDHHYIESVLVIGGAGTIGSNYIKQLFEFNPSKIIVVDINENGLTELTRDLRSSNHLDYNPEYITTLLIYLAKHLTRFSGQTNLI